MAKIPPSKQKHFSFFKRKNTAILMTNKEEETKNRQEKTRKNNFFFFLNVGREREQTISRIAHFKCFKKKLI
jgi:hypothetical protein